MSFGFCPDCNIPAKQNFFSASCEKCGIALKPSGTTTGIKTIISIGSLLVAMYFAQQATPQIIERTPDNLRNVLFWYYMKLCMAALAASYFGQFVIHKWFTRYVPESKNT